MLHNKRISGLKLLTILTTVAVASFIAAIYIVQIEMIASIPLYSAHDPIENITLALLVIFIGIAIALDANESKSTIEMLTGGVIIFFLSIAAFLFSLPGALAVPVLLKILAMTFRFILKDKI